MVGTYAAAQYVPDQVRELSGFLVVGCLFDRNSGPNVQKVNHPRALEPYKCPFVNSDADALLSV